MLALSDLQACEETELAAGMDRKEAWNQSLIFPVKPAFFIPDS